MILIFLYFPVFSKFSTKSVTPPRLESISDSYYFTKNNTTCKYIKR